MDAWIAARAAPVAAVRRLIDEMQAGGEGWSFPKLAIANNALRDLVASAT